MGFDQKDTRVLWVERGATGQWVVTEDGSDRPLAYFDAQRDALSYADHLAKTKSGSRVKVFDETGNELLASEVADLMQAWSEPEAGMGPVDPFPGERIAREWQGWGLIEAMELRQGWRA